jgi:hypothetical protein
MNTLLIILMGIMLALLNPLLLLAMPLILWGVNSADRTESAVSNATGSEAAGGCVGGIVFVFCLIVFSLAGLALFAMAIEGSDCPTALINQVMGRCP